MMKKNGKAKVTEGSWGGEDVMTRPRRPRGHSQETTSNHELEMSGGWMHLHYRHHPNVEIDCVQSPRRSGKWYVVVIQQTEHPSCDDGGRPAAVMWEG